MIETLLKGIGEYENVEVYTKTSTVKENGSEKIIWSLTGTILCNIQENGDFGQELMSSEKGDDLTGVYNLRTASEIKDGQRIKRIDTDGLIYEVRRTYHAGRGTIIDHYKAYLIRVDNQ